MQTYLYRLKFPGPVHFGATGIGLEITLERLSSDSLTSALINAFAILGDADEVVKALRGEEPPFILSSLFPFGPFYNSSVRVYALPRPLGTPVIKDSSILARVGKELKRLRYVLPTDFFDWIGDKPLDFQRIEQIIENSGRLAMPWDRGEQNGWWASELRPRVALDRASQNSNIWFCGTLYFHKEAGLYGLVKVSDDEWRNRLTTAFNLLGDLGIGGERTYGFGSFDFSGFEPLDSSWSFSYENGGSKHVLLSAYHPAEQERSNLRNILEAWDITESRGHVVSGRLATTLKRKRVRMILEGSLVKEPVRGAMVDVTPDNAKQLGLPHKVYRSGLAFLMPEGGTP